jgi:hypothetical protein
MLVAELSIQVASFLQEVQRSSLLAGIACGLSEVE